MITGVGNIEIVDSINGNARHVIQSRIRCIDPVTSEASDTGTSNGYDLACRYHHFTDAVIVGVRDEDIARSVDSNSFWVVQSSRCRIDSISIVASDNSTRNCCDFPGANCHFSKAIVEGVRNIDIALCINSTSQGSTYLSSCSIDVVTIVASDTRASNCRDKSSACRHFSNTIICRVSNVDIAICINGNACWSL